MPCGGAFIFDQESEKALRDVWQVVAQAGGSNTMLGLDYPPHLTLFMAEGLDMEGMKTGFKRLASTTLPLEITLTSLGVFPGEFGVLYIAPVVSRELLDLHACYYSLVAHYGHQPSDNYRAEMWVPHITIGYGLAPDALGAAVTALMRVKLPKMARIAGLTVGCFNLTGQSNLSQVMFGEG